MHPLQCLAFLSSSVQRHLTNPIRKSMQCSACMGSASASAAAHTGMHATSGAIAHAQLQPYAVSAFRPENQLQRTHLRRKVVAGPQCQIPQLSRFPCCGPSACWARDVSMPLQGVAFRLRALACSEAWACNIPGCSILIQFHTA